jgi:hypothetical protein
MSIKDLSKMDGQAMAMNTNKLPSFFRDPE